MSQSNQDKNFSNEILQSLLNMDNSIFFVLDRNYKYITYSQNHFDIMKKIWAAEISVGLCMLDAIGYENDRLKAKTKFDKVLLGEKFTIFEEYGDNKLFRTFWENRYTPVKNTNGEVIGISVFTIELTQQIKLQNRFNELKFFEQIVNKTRNGIALADPNKKNMPLVFVNDAFCDITGYSRNEVIGKNCRFLQGKNRDFEKVKTIREAIKNKQSCEIILNNYKKDGTSFKNLLTLAPIFGENNELVYYAGTQFDITAQIGQKKLEFLKKIASGLTHEINTALASLRGNLDILSYDINHVSDEVSKNYMKESILKIRESEQSIFKIVSSLHYLNATTIQKEEYFELTQTIKDAISYFESKIRLARIDVVLDSQEIYIVGEKGSIGHIWKILLENSIDALIENEGTKEILIRTTKLRDEIVVSFTDNGKGIEENIKKELFSLLATGKSHKGIGIGLYIAKSIAKLHGGDIVFMKEENLTRFDVKIRV